ncbi:putative Ig domain-containing protein [Yinghuangia soli]|uniref:Ig domain-containing protein n=1 Tax=Yinghuangia soli TaxID=2908204 RepID=A0AA41PTV2_9ACTN|nr:putative Ig domain-containing protein [Yinghuangia soli]MCF2525618.1 Ig domain-containing protein [Yinghuangia soli]
MNRQPSQPRRGGRSAGRMSAVLVVAGLAAATLGATPAQAADPPTTVCTIGDARIGESSGLALSVKHPGVMYTHNDSGNTTELFALDMATCAVRAVFNVTGTSNSDWEAMSVGKDEQGRPAVFIGDIGDNLSARSDLKIHRFAEPDSLTNQNVTPTTYAVAYADGKHDAETMMIDPRDNRVYIATKILFGTGTSGVYQGPATLSTSGTNTFTKVGNSVLTGTDGSFAPNGRSFTVRDYNSAYVYSSPGVQIATFALPSVSQGESLTYTPDGKALLVGTEGGNSPVWKVPLPPEAIPGGDAPMLTDPGAQTSDVGTADNLALQVSGGTGPYTCTFTGLPAGLSNPGGGCTVQGTPTTAGTSNATATAKDATNTNSNTVAFSWTVSPVGGGDRPPVLTAPGNQTTAPGTAVSLQLQVTGSPAPTCTATGLPAGLAISPSCLVTGTPTTAGTSNVVVTAANRAGTDARAFVWTIGTTGPGPVAPTVTSPGAQSTQVGTAVNLQVQRTGSPVPTCAASGLPAGLAINSGCLISGTPTAAGSSNVTVTATNTAGSASASFAWTVTPPQPTGVVVTNPGQQTSKFNQKANLQIQATPSVPGSALTYSATGLPFGVGINSSTGAITGSVWGVGTFQVTVKATDATGQSGTAAFTWTVTWF